MMKIDGFKPLQVVWTQQKTACFVRFKTHQTVHNRFYLTAMRAQDDVSTYNVYEFCHQCSWCLQGRRGAKVSLKMSQHPVLAAHRCHFITPQPRCRLCCLSDRYTSIFSIVISKCSNRPESHVGQQTEPEKKKKKGRKNTGKSVFSSPLLSLVFIFLTMRGKKEAFVFSFTQVHYLHKDLPEQSVLGTIFAVLQTQMENMLLLLTGEEPKPCQSRKRARQREERERGAALFSKGDIRIIGITWGDKTQWGMCKHWPAGGVSGSWTVSIYS